MYFISVRTERSVRFAYHKKLEWNCNKKVLLRERKRHTARKRAQDADPPRWLTPPPGWTWPPPADWPPQLDLTPPPLADLIPHQLDLTPSPRRLDLTPPGFTWPPPAGLTFDPDPPWLDLTFDPDPSPRLDLSPLRRLDLTPPPPGVDKVKTLPSPSFGCGR